jgi:hypothetical protein
MNSGQTNPNWVELYRAALMETKKEKLRVGIELAQKALHERERQLTENGEGSGQERLAIDDALRALRSLLELYALQ